MPEPATLSETHLRGTALYRERRYAEAADIFGDLVAGDAADAAALRLLGLCRIRLGDPRAGEALLARAVALAPNDPELLLHHGIGLLACGRAAEAAAQFERASPLLPDDPAPQLNLATALLALGDAAGARRAARKAALRDPNLAQAHYIRGLAELGLDALADAEAAFARATKCEPGFAEAWVNLGVARYRQYELTGAKQAMRRALQVAPQHPAAIANLAVFERLSGDVQHGDARLAAAFERAPGDAEIRLAHATRLIGEEGAAAALAILEEAPPEGDPALRLHWRLQHLVALILLNRLQEARALLAELGPVPSALAPLLEFRRLLLAVRAGAPGRARAHAETMEGQLRATPEMVPEHRIMGWIDLGRFWRQQNEPARAFTAWTEAHRLLGRLQPFSRDAYAAFVEAAMQAFDAARLHDGPRAANADPAPVFIVGMPRSGTTLTEQILDSHPEAFGAGERNALAASFRALGREWESPAAVRRVGRLGPAAFDREAERYLAELHALGPDKARIVDKMPGNFRLLGYAALLLPGARVIYCERDSRDIGLSIFQHRFYGYHPYAHDLADLGWYIAQQRRLMRHWQEVLPIPLLTVRLTDWVENFPETLRRVLDFVGLPHDPACERFYENEREVRTVSRWQVRRPINAEGIGRWREYAEPLAPLITGLREAGVALDPLT